jgi:cephalosporin hydroxylase
MYDLWLPPYRDRATNVVEVGVCHYGGGSVLALAEYFRNATVWAVDTDRSKCCKYVFDHPRIRFVHGDAYKDGIASLLPNQIDVVIDDCLHEATDQLKLLRLLLPSLATDGIYVVEDCIATDWIRILPELWDMGLSHILVDCQKKGAPGVSCLVKLQRSKPKTFSWG